MVSGFFTSPCDHSRIFSGEASWMRMAENESGSFGFSKKLKMSFTGVSYLAASAADLTKNLTSMNSLRFDLQLVVHNRSNPGHSQHLVFFNELHIQRQRL